MMTDPIADMLTRIRKRRVLVVSLSGVSDAREHVSDWIGHHDGTLLTSSTS